MNSDQLVIRTYDPSWPGEFERLRERALRVLGGVAVEHVGSTAVPGARSAASKAGVPARG
jgi:GrpB-like predicted nucleotidyltransferase (UPF0157 family)